MPKRRFLVTGASSGIGLALVRQLSARGDTVLCTGRRPPAKLPPGFPECAYLALDLADADGPARLVDWIGAPLDAAILNAGTGHYRPLDRETPDDIAAVLDTNLTAPACLAHALYPGLVAKRGRLGLIGSVAWKGAATMPLYAASKAALDGFGRALAAEWAGRVTVRVIHPGPTATGMARRAGRPSDWVDRIMLPPDAVARGILAALEGRGSWRRVVSFGQVLPRLVRGRPA